MAQLEIVVDGRWQSLDCIPGDVTMSTVWPGGSDQLTWTPGTTTSSRRHGGEQVTAYLGPLPVWAGTLSEPDASQEQLTAVGAWQDGVGYAALDGVGNATAILDTAVDQAISRGLGWTRLISLSAATAPVDISQGPMKVGDLLDAWAAANTKRWGVNPVRQVYAKTDDPIPTYQTLRLAGGLGFALDDYASTLVGRYLDSATSTYKTVTVTDSAAQTSHGHIEDVVDLTVRGGISTATATAILTSLLALGRAVPQWTGNLEVTYGEVFNMGGTPVALETVAAGALLRIHGGYELAQRLNGQMYLDVPIGRTQLAGGLLQIQPADVVIGNLADAVTAALTRRP